MKIGTDPQSSKNLLIGAGYNTGGVLYRFLDGEMSNLAIWNSDQSGGIANIYNNGSPQITIHSYSTKLVETKCRFCLYA